MQGVALDKFRFTTNELMAVVVLAALDFAAFRYPLIGRPFIEVLLVLGGLPTANILAIGLLLLCRESWANGVRRQRLVGFEVVGWATLLVFAAVAIHHSDAIQDYVQLAIRKAGLWRIGRVFVAAAAFLSIPQLFIALLGGWLSTRMRCIVLPSASNDGSKGFKNGS